MTCIDLQKPHGCCVVSAASAGVYDDDGAGAGAGVDGGAGDAW